jgi:PAS domain S-box-containing protein
MTDDSRKNEADEIEIETETPSETLSVPSDTIYIGSIYPDNLTTSGSFDVKGLQSLSFTRLLSALPLPALLVDDSRRIVFVNDACRPEGKSSKSLIGKRVSNLFPDLDTAYEMNELVSETLASRKPQETQCEIVLGHRKMWARIRLRSIRLGTFRACLMLMENLTHEMERLAEERRHQDRLRKAWEELERANARLTREMRERELAEEATRRNQEKYRLLVENAPVGIAFIAEDGKVLEVNKALSQVIGVTDPQELQGADMLTHSLLISTGVSEAFRRCMETGLAVRKEIRWPLPSGSEAFLALILTPLTGPDGQTRGYQAVVEDVTARKTAERLALYSQSMQAASELADAMAHTFNNFLQTVIGGAELAVTNLELGALSEVRETLDTILRLSRSGATAVRRVHYLSRAQDEQAECLEDGLDLSRIAHQAIEMSRPWWKSHPQRDGVKVSLRRNLGPDCLVAGNENELFELVVHLVRNAAEALPEGGVIDVRTLLRNDRVVLEVQDNGMGISPDDLPKIFQPLWTTKGALGTGIGLARCKSIVERHGGKITAESSLGKGTVFTADFPAGSGPVCRIRAPLAADWDTRLTILVIDDLEPYVRMLRDSLTKAGQVALVALSGRRGLDIFKSSTVDAVVCDLGMPEMNGRQVAEFIRDFCREQGKPRPPFILLTGWPGNGARASKMAAAGVDRVLRKPVEFDRLLEVIREAVAEAHAHAAPQPSGEPSRSET